MTQNKNFRLNSNSSVFSNKDREASFAGDVKLVYDTMILKSPFAEFKYSKTKEVLEIVRAYDRVEMIDQNKTGTCSELIVNMPASNLILKSDFSYPGTEGISIPYLNLYFLFFNNSSLFQNFFSFT